jgi:hypothetical protein
MTASLDKLNRLWWAWKFKMYMLYAAVTTTAFAQPLDTALPADTGKKATPMEEMTAFKEKQRDLMQLMQSQTAKIKQLTDELARYRRQTDGILNAVKYPNKIPFIRDSATALITKVRINTTQVSNKLGELCIEFSLKNRDLTAIYTRFGEMKAVNKTDKELTLFLQQHRAFMFLVEETTQKLTELLNDCDFLLTSKLN